MGQRQKFLMVPALAGIFLRGLGGQQGMTEAALVQFHAVARGFNRGEIYPQNGTLVASVAQEGLIRPRKK